MADIVDEEETFPCPACDEVFETLEELKNHSFSPSYFDDMHHCYKCGMKLSSNSKLIRHMVSVHTNSGVSKDASSQNSDNTKGTLIATRKNIAPKKTSKNFKVRMLNRLGYEEVEETDLKEEEWDKAFLQGAMAVVLKYFCNNCNCKYVILTDTLRGGGASQADMFCYTCGDTCRLCEVLESESRWLSCKFCDSKFRSSEKLQRHVSLEHGPASRPSEPTRKPVYRCLQCNEAFTSAALLFQHKQRHTDSQADEPQETNQPKVEQICIPQSFMQRGRTTRVRPSVVCFYCQQVFASGQSLESHLLSAHSVAEPGPSYACELCGACFLSREAVQIHHNASHALLPLDDDEQEMKPSVKRRRADEQQLTEFDVMHAAIKVVCEAD